MVRGGGTPNMKLVYTNENRLIVANAQNLLSIDGIESELKNEYSSGGMGGLPPMETWAEIWVEIEDYSRAKAIVDKFMNAAPKETWICRGCSEENDGNFEICWNCQNQKA